MPTPTDVVVWQVAIALLLTLVLAWTLSAVARWLVRSRATLATAPAILVTIVGLASGLFVAGLIRPSAALWSPLTLVCALGMSVVGMAVYGAVATHVQRPHWAPIAELDTLERYQVAQVMQGLGYALEDVMAYLGEPDLVAALQRAQDARAESASQMARAFMAGEGAASYGG